MLGSWIFRLLRQTGKVTVFPKMADDGLCGSGAVLAEKMTSVFPFCRVRGCSRTHPGTAAGDGKAAGGGKYRSYSVSFYFHPTL